MRRRQSRSGSVIFIMVMGVLLVLGILGFSLYRSMTEKASFVNAHANAALLDFAALEMESTITDEVGRQLQKPDSGIFQSLLQAATNTAELDVSSNSSLWEKKFAFLGKKEFARLSWTNTVKFVGFSGLTGTGKWVDPNEKAFRLEIALDLSIGHVASQKLRKVYTFGRPGKIQRLALPVVSKFTLFVKAPEKTQGNTDGYNCFENMHDGNPTQSTFSSSKKSLPLVLFNSPKVKSTDLTKVGYVFLGGKEDIELHTTAGSHPDYGESFLFCAMGKPISSTIVFDLNSLPSTAAFSPSGIQLSKNPVLKGVLGIRAVVFGFYSVNGLGETMNYCDTLSRWFDPSNNVSMSSSFLHLYGSISNPSPTMVIGRVKRTYARYSKLVARLEGRTDFQGLCWLKNPVPMQSSSGRVDSWDQVPFPGTLNDRKTDTSYALSTDTLSMLASFGDPADPSGAWNNYLERSSGLYSEEYNRVYEYLFRKEEDLVFPPSKPSFEEKYGSYQKTGEDYALVRKDLTGQLFRSDLNNLTSEDLLRDRISMEVKSSKEFDEIFKDDKGNYDLKGRVILVKEGPFDLPATMKITKSGIIAVNGEIRVKGAVTCEGDAVVTLVSIGKDITLQGSNEEIQASLVALDGTVKSQSKAMLRVKGGLAMKSLATNDWRFGGQVTYDDRIDPCQPQAGSAYTAQVSDYHDRWNMEQALK